MTIDRYQYLLEGCFLGCAMVIAVLLLWVRRSDDTKSRPT